MISLSKLRPILQKAGKLNSKPTAESFPELPEVLVWARFCLAIVFGLYLGLNSVMSPTMPLQALNLIAFVPIMYTSLYLGADTESFGMKLIFAGTMNAVALCMLIWIYLYTANNEESVLKIAALLVPSAVSPDADAVVGEDSPGGAVEEPEF